MLHRYSGNRCHGSGVRNRVGKPGLALAGCVTAMDNCVPKLEFGNEGQISVKQRRTRIRVAWIVGSFLLITAVLLVGAIHRMDTVADEFNTCRSRGDLKSIQASLHAYATANGFYPTTEQGLHALAERPKSEPLPLPTPAGRTVRSSTTVTWCRSSAAYLTRSIRH